MKDKTEEQITLGLYQFYIECGHEREKALERLISVLALEPAMFTRMVPVLDELRERK